MTSSQVHVVPLLTEWTDLEVYRRESFERLADDYDNYKWTDSKFLFQFLKKFSSMAKNGFEKTIFTRA